jgi:23S rRNA pseudouridine1911/1915/1917 synthase
MTAPLLDVLHDDDNLLVVNKPGGLVCHPTKNGELSSLIGRVRLYLGHAEGRLVNRLDRETSGIVVIAKSALVAGELGRLFAGSAVSKTYLALVHGHMSDGQVTIEAPLGRDEASPVAIKDCVRADGAAASTAVRLLRTFTRAEGAFSLVEVIPRTGRKHQIRIHLAHIGHPIVGDKLYGGDEQRYLRLVTDTLTEHDRRALMLECHALHASRLAFLWRTRTWEWTVDPPDAFLSFTDVANTR